MEHTELLQAMRDGLRTAFGDRLRGLVLYGSRAAGAAAAHSDLDVLVLLRAPIRLGHDLETVIDAIYRLQLESDIPIHALPVDVEAFEAGQFGLYRNARREGLRL